MRRYSQKVPMQTREILASPRSLYCLFVFFLNWSSFKSPRKHFEIGEVATDASWGVGFTSKGKGTHQEYALCVFEDGSSTLPSPSDLLRVCSKEN